MHPHQPNNNNNNNKRKISNWNSFFRERIGRCIKAKQCKPEEVFWAATGQCFLKYTKGPCPDGELITLNKGKRPPTQKGCESEIFLIHIHRDFQKLN